MFEIQTSRSGVLTWATRGTKRKTWLVKQGSSGSSRSPSQHTTHAFDCLTWIWRIFFFNFNDLKFSLFTQLCVSIPMTLYMLWRLHRTWKLSCLPTFQIFQFQTLKYVQLKFFNYFWRRISGHLKNNYVFTWVWHPFYLFPLSHEFTVIFLLLLYLLTAFASRWMSTYTHISLPLHSPTIILGKKTLKNKK